MMQNSTHCRRRGLVCAVAAALASSTSVTADTILRVDGDSGSPTGNGDSWATAFEYLQDALAEAAEHATQLNPYEIWVAATDPGNPYRPDRSAATPNGSDPIDRASTFRMANNVALYGGFWGLDHPTLTEGEDDLTQRDPINNVTVLSGAVGVVSAPCGPPNSASCFKRHLMISGCSDGPCCELVCSINLFFSQCCTQGWSDPCVTAAMALCPAGAFHVVTAEIDAGGPLDLTARIDGFTITGGSANVNEDYINYGGGMFIRQSSPAVAQCTFVDNRAIRGGGLAVRDAESEPIIANCTFMNNMATEDGGGA